MPALTACREDFSRSVWKAVLIGAIEFGEIEELRKKYGKLAEDPLLCPLLLRHNRIWFWLFLLRLALQEILQVLEY